MNFIFLLSFLCFSTNIFAPLNQDTSNSNSNNHENMHLLMYNVCIKNEIQKILSNHSKSMLQNKAILPGLIIAFGGCENFQNFDLSNAYTAKEIEKFIKIGFFNKVQDQNKSDLLCCFFGNLMYDLNQNNSLDINNYIYGYDFKDLLSILNILENWKNLTFTNLTFCSTENKKETLSSHLKESLNKKYLDSLFFSNWFYLFPEKNVVTFNYDVIFNNHKNDYLQVKKFIADLFYYIVSYSYEKFLCMPLIISSFENSKPNHFVFIGSKVENGVKKIFYIDPLGEFSVYNWAASNFCKRILENKKLNENMKYFSVNFPKLQNEQKPWSCGHQVLRLMEYFVKNAADKTLNFILSVIKHDQIEFARTEEAILKYIKNLLKKVERLS